MAINDMKGSSPVPSITDVLKKISDDKTLILFNRIAVSKGDRNVHLKEMSLSTKQYYSRLSGLMACPRFIGYLSPCIGWNNVNTNIISPEVCPIIDCGFGWFGGWTVFWLCISYR
jgi:hypothetical protein